MNDLNENAPVDRTPELEARIEELTAKLEEATTMIAEYANLLITADEKIEELQNAAPREAAGDDELRALAATIRRARLNGHPDAPKHMESLLRLLGA